MRIAILSTISLYEWAGTEEVWAQFAKVALQQGHAVHVSVHWRVAQSTRLQALQQLGLEVSVRQPFRPTRFYLLKERFQSDMNAVERFKPDALIINSGSLFDVLNLPALRQFCDRMTLPKIFFCHFVAEGFVPQSRENMRVFAETMQGWIFVSEHNKRLAERQLAYRFKNAQVIANAPRLQLDGPLPWPAEDVFQFACVARLETRWKGQDVLLEVLSRDDWRDRPWHLNLYGTGPDDTYISQLIEYYRLTEKVTCHGYISDIQSVWLKNHLMVLASRGEGMPLAVLEAMMCARSTVTTNVGGNQEILTSGKTGFIAEAATDNSFGVAMDQAWGLRDRWRQMGTNAYASITQNSSDPAKHTLNYIDSLLNSL